MMNRASLVAGLLLIGCGGEPFDAFGQIALDGGAVAADSGAGGSDGAAVPSASGGGDDGAVTASGGAETDGGTPPASGGSDGSGGSAAGGAPGSGGASSGGSDGTAAGGASSGGAQGSGGEVTSTGGTVACTPVTHDNGIGQTWQDCVPLYTYDKDQAMKACKAAGAPVCIENERCGTGVYEVQGFSADRSLRLGEWGYGNFATGYVSPDNNLCSPGDPARKTWN